MFKPKSPIIKIRRRWKINPQTKIKESGKRYLRSREKRNVCKAIKKTTQKNT